MAKTETDPFDFAPGWKPDAGETITGKVESLDIGESQYGRYPIVTILQDNGERIAVHGFHTVLMNSLRRTRPVPGDKLAIRYLGMVTPDGGGQEYQGYQVRKLDIDTTDFWGKASPESEPWANDEPPF